MITRRSMLASSLATVSTFGRGRCGVFAKEPEKKDPGDRDKLLSEVMDRAIAEGQIPGGSLVALHRGEVVFRRAFGMANLESKRPFTTETPCFLASLTKPIVATLFVLLDEQGVVLLDDPVEKFLPEFKGLRVRGQTAATTPPRVWHLLAHQAGLPGNGDKGVVRPSRHNRTTLEDLEAGKTPEQAEALAFGAQAALPELIQGWIKDGLIAEPGTRFAYGSTGYLVASRIVEIATGKTLETMLEEKLVQPLGMSHTTFRPSVDMFRRMASRYNPTKNGLELEPKPFPVIVEGGLVNPAGGLFSTLDDMTAFMGLHLRGGVVNGQRLLPAASLARMYQDRPLRNASATSDRRYGRSGEEGPYGLGWNLSLQGGAVRHLGGAGTLAWLNLKGQHAGVLLTQVPLNGKHQLIDALLKAVEEAFA